MFGHLPSMKSVSSLKHLCQQSPLPHSLIAPVTSQNFSSRERSADEMSKVSYGSLHKVNKNVLFISFLAMFSFPLKFRGATGES